MTDDQIEAWEVERDMARAIKNPEDRQIALQKCYDHRDKMMMTCIAHQSKRSKEQEQKIDEIMLHHNAMVKSHQEFQKMIVEEKAEKDAYKKVIAIIKWLAALCGGGGIGAVITNIFGG